MRNSKFFVQLVNNNSNDVDRIINLLIKIYILIAIILNIDAIYKRIAATGTDIFLIFVKKERIIWSVL